MSTTTCQFSPASLFRTSQDEEVVWEMASLKMRSMTLAAENEALRGHVQHLQDELASFERNDQVS